MRVEQRIGRVDRIGQASTVQVFNFWVQGTVEERVLDVLERRINVFEETVGGLDPILGDTERDLDQDPPAGRRGTGTCAAPVRGTDRSPDAGSARGRGEAAGLHHGDQELLAGDRGTGDGRISRDQPGGHGTVRQDACSPTSTPTSTGSRTARSTSHSMSPSSATIRSTARTSCEGESSHSDRTCSQTASMWSTSPSGTPSSMT